MAKLRKSDRQQSVAFRKAARELGCDEIRGTISECSADSSKAQAERDQISCP